MYFWGGEGREKEVEKEAEKHHVCLPLPTRDLAHDPGMCPDWESNQWSFGFQASAQFIEPHQPGLEKEED